MSTKALLDPRYHWLMDAARRIYAQLDPGEELIVLTLLSGSGDGEMLSTQVMDGMAGVQRLLVTDQSAALRVGEDFVAENAVKLTPDDLYQG